MLTMKQRCEGNKYLASIREQQGAEVISAGRETDDRHPIWRGSQEPVAPTKAINSQGMPWEPSVLATILDGAGLISVSAGAYTRQDAWDALQAEKRENARRAWEAEQARRRDEWLARREAESNAKAALKAERKAKREAMRVACKGSPAQVDPSREDLARSAAYQADQLGARSRVADRLESYDEEQAMAALLKIHKGAKR